MQEQDEVLLASATIWDLDHPTPVASLRTRASSLMGIASSNAASVPCPVFPWQLHMMVREQVGRSS
jgi:hypothetical protein